MSEFIGESTIIVRADTRPFLFRVKKDVEAAERIAATITVKANTKLFRSQVRAVAAETNQFVHATVIVKADTRAFKFGVKRAVAEAQKAPVLLDVNADVRALRANIVAALDRSKRGLSFSIPARVDPKGLRAQLIEAVRRAEKGVTARVGVVASGAVAGGAARAATAPAAAAATAAPAVASVTGANRREASAVEAINTATQAGIAARRRLSNELSTEEKRSARLTRELASLRAAQEAVRRSVISNNKALIEQAEELQRNAAAAVQATRAQQERAAARSPAARAAAIEQAAAAELAVRKKLEAEVTKAHGEALREQERLDKDAAKRLTNLQAQAIAENTRRDEQARRARQAAIGPTAHGAALAEDKQRALFGRQLTASTEAQAEAQRRLTIIEQGALSVEQQLAEAKLVQAATTASVTNAEKALATARQINNSEFAAAAQQQLTSAQKARAAQSSTLIDVRAAAEAEKKLTQSIRQSTIASQEIFGAKNEEDAANRRLAASKRSLVLANEAEAAAINITNAEIKRSILLRIEEQQVTARSAATELATAAKRAGANKSVRESILANTLSLLGLRGSALAANAAFLGTSAVIISLAKSVGLAAQLASQLNVFQATAGATAEQMDRVSASAEQLGRDMSLPGVGATDAAQALTELSKAGLSVQDSIDGARGVLQLATAAAIDNAQATELVAAALNAFGLAGDQAVRVADDLANAANDSQGSIVDMGIALQQSSAVARQAGLSLEQTVAALTILARAGLRSSDAGTSLRTALIRLINPSKKAQEEINRLGLSVRTSTGAINLNVFDEFTQKTRDFTKAQRDQALAVIFGQDAIRAAAILARSGSSGLDAQVKSIEKQGTAAQLATARMKGLTGSAENLKNQLSALGIEVGKLATGPLVLLTTSLAETAGALADLLGLATKLSETEIIPKVDIGGTDSNEIIKESLKFAFSSLPTLTVKAFKPIVEDLKGVNDAAEEAASVGVTRLIGKLSDAQARYGATSEEARKLTRSVVNSGLAFAHTAAGVETVSRAFAAKSPEIAKAIEDGIITPAERAVIGTTELGQAFLRFIDQVGNRKSNLGANIASGVEDAAREAKRHATDLTEGLKNRLDEGTDRAAHSFGAKLADGIRTGFFRAIAVVRSSGQQLEDEMNRAIIAGAGHGTIVNILNKEFANQQRRIDAANKRLAEIPAKDQSKTAKAARARARNEISEATAEQARITGDIKSENDAVNSEKEQAAQDITQARNKADQKLLDALSGGRTPFERRITLAQDVPGAPGEVAALVAFRKRLQFEVAQVKAGVKDGKTKTEQLDKLSDDLFQNSEDIKAARKRRNEAVTEALTDRGTALQQLGETTGNIKLILRGLDLQIAGAKQLVAKAHQSAVAQLQAKAALEALRKQRREVITEAKNALLSQAFDLAEARGNKSQMLQIIDLQIAQAKQEEKAAKTLLERLAAATTIAQLIQKKRDILADNLEQQKQGTTAFDLLKKNVEAFTASAGNLVFQGQPFAGANAFNADIAQFLKFQGKPGAGAGRLTDAGGLPQIDRLDRVARKEKEQTALTNTLIAALKELTQATLAASGNSSTGSVTTKPKTKGSPWAGRPWFAAGQWQRSAQES